MLDNEQWELYGMFVCLLESEYELLTVESMVIEAEGEGMEEYLNKGFAEMKIWLRLYVKDKFNRRIAKRMLNSVFFQPNPMTIH
jgi:hypothetical protein